MNSALLKLLGLNVVLFVVFFLLCCIPLPSPLQLNGLKMADEPMEEGEPYSYHVSTFAEWPV